MMICLGNLLGIDNGRWCIPLSPRMISIDSPTLSPATKKTFRDSTNVRIPLACVQSIVSEFERKDF